MQTDSESCRLAMVFNIQRFSLHDGEGIRTLVFFKGCPLRCEWCANPEGQNFETELFFDNRKCIGCRSCMAAARKGELEWDDGIRIRRENVRRPERLVQACPSEALTAAGEEKTIETILAAAERDRVFYRDSGGITLSGGEPFAQPRLAKGLAAEAKRRDMGTAVETCLGVPWRNVEPSLPFLDRVYADVKHVNTEKYAAATGGDLALPSENIRRLAKSGIPTTARTPVVPGFNDSPEELDAIAGFVAGTGIGELRLMPYHTYGEEKYRLLGRIPPLAGTPASRPEDLTESAEDLAQRFGLRVGIGG